MCTPKAPTPQPAPPAPPPPPPVAAPMVLQTAKGEGSTGANAAATTKGRKSLRIDLASSAQGGSSGLNLPVGG